ncbi:MAG: agmatinase [Elusimicrobia bacterium]|nr:agmatinase [Elusimicrobiota bacterium]
MLLLPFERTTSHRKGTGQGPAALLAGSLGLELFDEELGRQTYKAGIHTMSLPSGRLSAEAYFPKVSAAVSRLLKLGKTVFSVGGEHSLSQAIIPPHLERWPDLSVLHFDAHADLRPTYEGSPHNHACAMFPVSRLCPVTQVGIRSVGEEEAHLVGQGKVTTFFMHEHRDLKALTRKVLASLKGTVYLSLDLDGFDPSVVPGVGTPQPGGFGWYEALDLLRAVFMSRRVVGADIMELCPGKHEVSSELAASKVLYRLMGWMLARQ